MDIPLVAEWKINCGDKKRNRKIISRAIEAQVKGCGNLEKVQAGEVVSFEMYLDSRSYHVPGLRRIKKLRV